MTFRAGSSRSTALWVKQSALDRLSFADRSFVPEIDSRHRRRLREAERAQIVGAMSIDCTGCSITDGAILPGQRTRIGVRSPESYGERWRGGSRACPGSESTRCRRRK